MWETAAAMHTPLALLTMRGAGRRRENGAEAANVVSPVGSVGNSRRRRLHRRRRRRRRWSGGGKLERSVGRQTVERG